MNFSVIFRTESNKDKLIEYIGSAGMDILDTLREAVPFLKTIKTEKIYISTECPIGSYMIHIALTEDEARASNYFGAKTSIEVIVPPLFLSRFVEWETLKEHETKTTFKVLSHKTINCVRCEQRLDEVRLLQAWVDAKYPLRWEVS